jgi:hypothetical protein
VSPSFPKDGDIRCEPYLDDVRGRGCYFCPEPPPSQAHHYPPKGRGVTDDTSTIPVCVRCHQRCEGITVVHRGERLEPISEERQERAANDILRCFLATASTDALHAFTAALERWRSTRVYLVPL